MLYPIPIPTFPLKGKEPPHPSPQRFKCSLVPNKLVERENKVRRSLVALF